MAFKAINAYEFLVRWEDVASITSKTVLRVIRKHAHILNAEIKEAWPVDTGASKRGWYVMEGLSGYSLVNHVINTKTGEFYVPELWEGKSKQMPDGGDPIIRRRSRLLELDLKRMKLRGGKRRRGRKG